MVIVAKKGKRQRGKCIDLDKCKVKSYLKYIKIHVIQFKVTVHEFYVGVHGTVSSSGV